MSDDAQLIAHALNGSPDEYRHLVARHAGDIRGFILSQRPLVQAADETAVEAFTRAWLKLPTLRDRASFASWVKGIALRVIRENARTRPVLPLVGPEPRVANVADDDLEIRAALEALPEPYATAIRLRFFDGLSCQEIADRQSLALSTVTKQLSRAYALLRESLADKRPVAASK